jgi:thiamine kinase-like enzyme
VASAAAQLDGAIESLVAELGALEGEPVALSGGITNRNFRARMGGAEYVVRLHGAQTDVLGIDRESEREANEAAAALGIAPAVVAHGEGFLVTEYVACSSLDARGVAQRVAQLGRALSSFHNSGTTLRARFDVRGLLEVYAAEVQVRGGAIPPSFARAQQAAERIGETLGDTQQQLCPCHNDLLAGNVIGVDDARVLIVDWEYAGMGQAYFDLGNASVNNDFGEEDDERLLAAYLQREPSDRERGRLKLMRVLSDAREGAWGVLQAMVSELAFDFEAYAREHFERMSSAVEAARYEEWLAAAA